MEIIKNNKSSLVRLREKYLRGFPLVNIKEDFLWISEEYDFSSLTYIRPQIDSNIGRIEVKLISKTDEVIYQQIELSFKHTEAERLEDAKKPESFKLSPEALNSDFALINQKDISNIYSDVMILKANSFETKAHIKVKIQFCFVDEDNNLGDVQKVEIVLADNKKETLKQWSVTGELDVNILNLTNSEIKEGLILTLEQVSHNYILDPNFLGSPPPVSVPTSVIIPTNDVISFQKIDYIPPKNIDSKIGYMQVEYGLGHRVFNERVAFEFSGSIRDAAENVVGSTDPEDFSFIGPTRKVCPRNILYTFFEYAGDHAFTIVGIKVNKDLKNDDNRITQLTLLIRYRTVIVEYPLTIEFELSRNEYKKIALQEAKTENGSIKFDPKIFTAENIYKLYNKINVKKVMKDMIRSSKIVEDYPYERIESIEVINFIPSSRVVMFKIKAIEILENEKIVHIFEKKYIMKEAYDEWLLDGLKPKDIEIDDKYMTEYPPQTLHEKMFKSTEKYKIQWIQYIPPDNDEKEVAIKIKVISCNKEKFVIKKVKYKLSTREYLNKIQKKEILESLYRIKASDLQIGVDVSGSAPEKITSEDILGVPSGITCEVIYQPPKLGKRISRVIIKLKRDGYVVGFEQSILFREPYSKVSIIDK